MEKIAQALVDEKYRFSLLNISRNSVVEAFIQTSLSNADTESRHAKSLASI